jgi:hypothetical protein
MAFVITWRIAVRWKKAPAPIVVPGMRVEIKISPLAPLAAIYRETQICARHRLLKPTRENPGEGLMSVLKIKESFSPWNGFIGFSYENPLAFTGCRIGNDHRPRAPPMA